jgi:hypothetical protein
MGAGAAKGGSLVMVVVMTIAYAAFCLTVGKALMLRLFSFFHVLRLPSEGILGVAVLVAFLCAAVAQWIGVHAIFGAFLAGVMIGETGEVANHTRETMRGFVFYLFSPLFFASMGMRADFISRFDPFLVFAVLAIACFGKVLGCSLDARLGDEAGARARRRLRLDAAGGDGACSRISRARILAHRRNGLRGARGDRDRDGNDRRAAYQVDRARRDGSFVNPRSPPDDALIRRKNPWRHPSTSP